MAGEANHSGDRLEEGREKDADSSISPSSKGKKNVKE